jgi:hypothetical protein
VTPDERRANVESFICGVAGSITDLADECLSMGEPTLYQLDRILARTICDLRDAGFDVGRHE